MGSIMIPSHISTDPTGSVGRANWSTGPTTVGPETTRIEAKRSARMNGTFKTIKTANVPKASVIITPSVTNLHTALLAFGLRSWMRNSKPPFKRSMPTPRVTMGKRESPKISKGFTRPKTGPTNIPAGRSNIIPGILMVRANHCREIPNPIIRPKPNNI